MRLNTDDLYTAVRSVSPSGALPFRGALNLQGSHFTADIFGASADQEILGRVDLQLAVEHNKIIVLNKAWIAGLFSALPHNHPPSSCWPNGLGFAM